MTTLSEHQTEAHAAASGAADAHHDRPEHLAHHFDSAPQQFEAAKLGMWLFLATEVLLFGGLFCGYAVYRSNHTEIFEYGSRYLDRFWGAFNTVVLILSSFTMATAVTAAQRSNRPLLITGLLLTFVGGATFMGVKYIEYSHKFHDNLVWGPRFYEDPHAHAAGAHAEAEAGQAEPLVGDPEIGRTLWMGTCRSCHAEGGQGMPGQGKDIRGSEFIAARTDRELLDFVKVGRMPFDPLNTTGIQMPPRGGNPLLKDPDLLNIIAFVRTFKAPEGGAAAEQAAAAEGATEEAFWIPTSTIPPAAVGPSGIRISELEPSAAGGVPPEPILPSRDPNRPANAHMFFAIYFMMTGLHGIHVLAGMAVMVWLLVGALRGRFSASYFTPVDLGGLYWHVVDLIWIFLFPLFYLIG